MAFHDGWEEEPQRESLGPVLRWTAIAMTGLTLGVACYFGLITSGVLAELVREPPPAAEAPEAGMLDDSSPGAPTSCPSPTTTPNSVVFEFVEDINTGRYFSAWSRLDLTFQQREYQLDSGAFQREWAPRGRVEVGQMTYSSPSETEAVLLAGLSFAEPQAVPGRFMFHLAYEQSTCSWMITQIEARSEG